MIEYVIPFILFIIFFWLLSFIDIIPIKLNKEQRTALVLLSIFILIIFAGGRWSEYEVGFDRDVFDYSTYKNIYYAPLNLSNFFTEYIYSDNEIKGQEIGYILYSSLCYLIIGHNFNIYLLVTNLVLIVLFYYSLRKNGINNAIFFIFFFFASRLYLQYNFVLLRQTISLMIIWMWGFPAILRKEKAKFLLIVLIASLFHFTALISIIALFLDRYINIKLIIYLIGLFFILSITRVIDIIIINIINLGLSLIGISWGIGEKLSKYLIGGDDGVYRGLNLLSFVELIPLIYILRKYREEICYKQVGRFYYNMFYIFILLMAITMNFGFLTRGIQYFMYSFIYIFSFYYNIEKNMSKRRLFFLIISCYLLTYSIRYIFMWFYNTEYSFFLFNY